MGIIMNDQNQRSELQKRIAAELAEKAKKKSLTPPGDRPDGVDDSAYLEKTKTTATLAWAWIVIIMAAVAILIWLVVISG
jgi:Flp pilus assembly protein TadB